jgi:hydrogenase maturation protein HypF
MLDSSQRESMMTAETIRVSGTVQGVGFRPFVWRLAQQFNLRGRVWNDGEGVMIEVWGEEQSMEAFRHQLQTAAPPLARVDAIRATPLAVSDIPPDFVIIGSQTGNTATNIAADAATCPQCRAEINDPANRRYRYPFTNCTHCGPRLSIIRAIPYDRANTSMQSFSMCPECQAEYDDPADRRFHAQPNACPGCGPQLWLEDNNGQSVSDGLAVDVIEHAASLIRQGYILAIKGIGGFHLACDAGNAEAVSRLRQRKQRYHKPFALMARDPGVIRNYATVSEEEAGLLQDPAAPIVILHALPEEALPEEVAPGQNRLGFMLPYTPLHHLLLQDMETALVMTSGNLSDEAQCIDNEQARQQLRGIADYFLLHDRDIVNRLDDSVVRVIEGRPQLLRRARGFAPAPLKLPPGFEHSPPILAMGAELKNTFCLLKDGNAVVSQHQGDLEDVSVLQDFRHNIELYQQLFDHRPEVIAIDHHPEYLSSKLGQELAVAGGVKLVPVQHHHAHIAACMAEHGLPLDSGSVLGIALDGLGYGDGGELWGGEFLLADYQGYRRMASFQAVAMPGGYRAMLEPWRNTFAHLQQSLGWEQVLQQYPELDFVRFMRDKPLTNLITMMEQGINSPPASSAGRLFDAVAGLLGICRDAVSYEGQAAMALEMMAEHTLAISKPYPYDINKGEENGLLTIQWRRFWQALLADEAAGESRAMIAGRFHQTLVHSVVDVIKRLSDQHPFGYVVLSGGVMQNQLLQTQLSSRLLSLGLTVLVPHQFPANDGGIALGQAVIAAALAGKSG